MEDGQIQYADKIKKSELIGSGCLVQVVGLIFPFIFGAIAGVPGVIGGIVLCLILLIAGSRMSIKWICGNCNNPLVNKSIKVCPACNAHFETAPSSTHSTSPQPGYWATKRR
ncbi:MAG: hypothetical protein K8R45_14485 [Desulfobacterales bacterium]|nr:hypothetical protein [Desulfobacterales bacterium]